MNFDVKKIYGDRGKRVVEYMELVVEQIERDYNAVPPSWRVSLDMIADNLMLYFDALDDIKKYGQVIHTNGKTEINPACRLLKDANQTIFKLVTNFALTPMSKSKMKKVDVDSQNILSDLLGQ
jgi:phage terminase small subunit